MILSTAHCASTAGNGSPPTSPDPLSFEVVDGDVQNRFLRGGPVAAHAVVRSGDRPRVVVAFPAGNAGVGLWLHGPDGPVMLHAAPLEPVSKDSSHGVRFELDAHTGELTVDRALLSSVRVLREYTHGRPVPPEVACAPTRRHGEVLWQRDRHALHLAPVLDTEASILDGGRVRLTAPSGSVRVRVTALTSEPPLHPLGADELLTDGAADDHQARQTLAFLSYREKLLAGSWRFLTYFGRDTLLSTRLLMPVLKDAAVEAALGSVVSRLDPNGHVSHEEGVGEWARLGPSGPRQDYKMVDDDLLLAPVLEAWRERTDRARVDAFLARRTPSSAPFSEGVADNLALVLRLARPFAASGAREDLIGLHEGESVGEWRDSEAGLGGGRVPFDVNVALMPAALQATAQLYESGLFGERAEEVAEARALADAWRSARPFFTVELDETTARARLEAYCAMEGLPCADARASLTGGISFPAIALDGSGAPLPIQHSDDGFVLLFLEPDPAVLEGAADRILRPFPAGLRTPAGIVVANPAFADDPALRARFTRFDYHGTVVWSWQQATLAAGLERQLRRADLPEVTRAKLAEAQRALWRVIEANRELRTSELWGFEVQRGTLRAAPFGQGASLGTESNAAQLWSTVWLAVKPPAL